MQGSFPLGNPKKSATAGAVTENCFSVWRVIHCMNLAMLWAMRADLENDVDCPAGQADNGTTLNGESQKLHSHRDLLAVKNGELWKVPG